MNRLYMIIKSLENTDWKSIANDNYINSTYNNFITKLWDTVNEYAPEKNININKYKTRQSEMANTSTRHMPVLGNVHPIKFENFDIFFVMWFLCSLEFLYY